MFLEQNTSIYQKDRKHLIEQQDEKEALNAEGQFSQNDKSNSLILGKC